MYQPNFTISNSILSNIGLIEAAKALIDTSPLLPSWEKKFQDEAIARTVHHGTHLEGNKLNFSEAKRVIEGENIVARERDIQEVINYRKVVAFIGNFTRQIDTALILQLHRLTTDRLIPQEQTGRLRDAAVVVRNSRTGEISFRPPPAVEVPYLLRSLLKWLNVNSAQYHSVIKAGAVHYELARIHPFIDGNGRVARATTMLILYKNGYDIRRFFSLEEYYDHNAQAYYQALQEATPADITPWLEYFVQGLAIEFNRVKEKIARISRDLKFQNTLGSQIYLNNRQLKIVEHIQEIGFLQNKSFARLFPELSDDTILRELKDLVKKHIIRKKGKTKAARYVLA